MLNLEPVNEPKFSVQNSGTHEGGEVEAFDLDGLEPGEVDRVQVRLLKVLGDSHPD
jgi:hypothetical protein